MFGAIKKVFLSFTIIVGLLVSSVPMEALATEVEEVAILETAEDVVATASQEEVSAIVQEIYGRLDAQIEKKESGSTIKVDVSDLEQYADDVVWKAVFEEVGSEDRLYRFYFIDSLISYKNANTGLITRLEFGPSAKYKEDGNINWALIDSELLEQEYEIKTALSCISEDMSIAEKLLVLHDYEILNCYYEKRANGGSLYAALVEGRAYCDGYAGGLMALAEAAGIGYSYVSSDAMVHGWVVVQLEDGNWYHIDPTWDDSVGEYTNNDCPTYGKDDEGELSYVDFLRNDTEIGESGHYDWVIESEVPSNTDIIADFGLHECVSRVNYAAGSWYYLNDLGTKCVIVKTSFAGDIEEEIPLDCKAYYMHAYKDKLYFNSDQMVYEYNPVTGDILEFYDLAANNYSDYVISEFSIFHQKKLMLTLYNSSTGDFKEIYINLESIPLENMMLTATSVVLDDEAATKQLEMAFIPYYADDIPIIIWTSNDKSVATVDDNGLVTAVANGTTEIIARNENFEEVGRCTVTVDRSAAVTGVDILQESLLLSILGEEAPLDMQVYPDNAANSQVTWESSDESVAMVDSYGTVTAVGNGTAIITVTTADGGFTDTCKITVDTGEVTKVSLNYSSKELTKVGETLQLVTTLVPTTATNKNIIWSSSDKYIASVDSNGLVTAVANGSCTITAKVEGTNKQATCSIVVNDAADAADDEVTEGSFTSKDIATMVDRIQEALAVQGSDSYVQVDISDLGLVNSTQTTALEDAVLEGLRYSPETFFIETVYSYNNTSTGVYEFVNCDFNSEYTVDGEPQWHRINAMIEALNYEITQALSCVSDSMSDAEKVLAIHDYLLANTNFYYEQYRTNGSYMEHVLLDGIANSKGYALVFRMLMEELGIECKTITDTVRDYAWNMVCIDDNWYHVDLAVSKTAEKTLSGHNIYGEGDDGEVNHIGLLKSDAELGTDYTWSEDAPDATVSEAFIGYCFDDVPYRMNYYNGIWYYMVPGESGSTIIKTPFDGSSRTHIAIEEPAYYMHGVENKMYYNTAQKIFVYDASTKVLKEYYDISEEYAGYVISEFTVRHQKLLALTLYSEESGSYVEVEIPLETISATTMYLKTTALVVGSKEDTDGLELVYVPSYATEILPVVWEVEDSTILTIDENGIIVPEYNVNGITEVTAKDQDGVVVGNCTVNLLIPIEVTGVSLNVHELKFTEPGMEVAGNSGISTHPFYPILEPADALEIGVNWESSNPAVAEVDILGNVYPIADGTAIITVTTVDGGFTDTCTVTVDTKSVTGLKIENMDLLMTKEDKTYQIGYLVLPSGAVNKNVTWVSSNPKVATVDENGVVTPLANGKTEIIGTTEEGGFTAAIVGQVLFQDKIRYLEIERGYETLQIELDKVGETKRLSLYMLPEDAVDADDVVWSSSNSKVATVDDNGLITAIAPGECYISVTNQAGTVSHSRLVIVNENTDSEDGEDSAEAKVKAFVERMYTVALERDAEQSGVDFWVESLMSLERDGASLSVEFILGPEFVGNNNSDSKFIEILYATFFDRAADEGGLTHWSNALANGTTRAEVLAGFVNSQEFFALCGDYGISRGALRSDGSVINPGIYRFAERLYTTILERDAERDGIEFWTFAMDNGEQTPESVAMSFFCLDEYQAKDSTNDEFVRTLYKTFMDREADADGLAFWKGRLEGGADRMDALRDFAACPEFQEIKAQYGL